MFFNKSNNAIIAKSRAMFRYRITATEYEELTKKSSVDEIFTHLRENPSYSELLSQINEKTIHRGQFEDLLFRSLFEKYKRLTRYSTGNSKFTSYYIIELETEQILSAIRCVNSGKMDEYIAGMPLFLSKSISFDLLKFANVKSLPEIAGFFSGTGYYKPLIAGGILDAKFDYLRCENELIKYYYKRIFALIDKEFHGNSQKMLFELFLTEAELKNLIVIRRIKSSYNEFFTPEEILSMLIDARHSISKRKLEELTESSTNAELDEIFKTTSYFRTYGSIPETYPESYEKHIIEMLTDKMIHFSTSPEVVAVSLVNYFKIEVSNLYNIIEGVRYRVSPEEIQKLLIL